MMEIKRVLIPIDFSDNAEKIVVAGAYVAGTFKAEVHLVFVVQNFDDYSGFFVPPVNLPNLEKELFDSAQERMEAFVRDHEEMIRSRGVPKIVHKVLAGDVAEELLNYAKSMDCDLIVMGTHGYKGLERILFGSIADKVVKNACCPVMTINPYREECEEARKV
ncbi:universal stress protein [Desulfolithobacter dissulfuricans]|uniref:Universal stress protein n=1 Tax=Desulfolithobacter dissulfuricans TaxID=2795293 RepID=A0A915TYA0_9BACT|nr:universal stress protein [Desulfolithobacter dissulfuricans]BCO07998.1 universal stress protein [Desulfolithobacter dissulfuricans]